MRSFFVLAGVVIIVLFQLSCGSDEEQTEPGPADMISSEEETVEETSEMLPVIDQVRLEDMSESEVRNLTSDSPIEMITVLEGTSKAKLQVRFRGVRDFGFGFPLYECE